MHVLLPACHTICFPSRTTVPTPKVEEKTQKALPFEKERALKLRNVGMERSPIRAKKETLSLLVR